MQAPKVAMSLTPSRIPRFIIPSQHSLFRSPGTLQDPERDRSRRLSPCSPHRYAPLSPTTPSPSSLTVRLKVHRATEDLSDPSTRGAMSLPHVDKITTPYGFRALAESPNTRRRESLFHKVATKTPVRPDGEQKKVYLKTPYPGRGHTRRTTRALSCDSVELVSDPDRAEARCAPPGLVASVPPGLVASVPLQKTSKVAGLQELLSRPLAAVRSLIPGRRKDYPAAADQETAR